MPRMRQDQKRGQEPKCEDRETVPGTFDRPWQGLGACYQLPRRRLYIDRFDFISSGMPNMKYVDCVAFYGDEDAVAVMLRLPMQ